MAAKEVHFRDTNTEDAMVLLCVGAAAQLGTDLHMHSKFLPQTLKIVRANSSCCQQQGNSKTCQVSWKQAF